MNYRAACKKCLICMYKNMILDTNIRSVFIELIPSYQHKIDVHLNIWREIMEFTAYKPNRLQKFASI